MRPISGDGVSCYQVYTSAERLLKDYPSSQWISIQLPDLYYGFFYGKGAVEWLSFIGDEAVLDLWAYDIEQILRMAELTKETT